MLFRILAFAFMAVAFSQEAPEAAPEFEPGECTTIAEGLASEDFAVFAELLELSGLDLEDFKGTIFVPSEAALGELVEALGAAVNETDFDEVLASLISYHAVPNVLLYSDFLAGFLDSNFAQIPMPTLADDGDVDDVCDFLGSPAGESTITFSTEQGLEIVEGFGEDADIEDEDLEFCGPIVIHVIDTVLIPCGAPPPAEAPAAAK